MPLTKISQQDVLYEDNHLLVIDKPSGIATMGAELGDATIARLAATYLKEKYNKPGNVYVGIVSRIDRLVSGVLVLARTSKCAARLSDQFRQRSTQKRYLAIIEGDIPASEADGGWITLTDYVRKNEPAQKMEIASQSAPGAQQAVLRLRPIDSWPGQTLIEVELETGRKHQIRLQLAAQGNPILGDQKYGSTRKFGSGISLHSYSLNLKHPTRDERLTFVSSPKRHWATARGGVLQAIADDPSLQSIQP